MRRTGVDTYPLAMRESDLIQAHHARWAQPIGQYVSGYQFFRGFVELVTCGRGVGSSRVPTSSTTLRRSCTLDLTDAALVSRTCSVRSGSSVIVSINLMRNDFGDAEARLLAGCPYLRTSSGSISATTRSATRGSRRWSRRRICPGWATSTSAYNATNDPTPRHADEYDVTSLVAQAWQQQYGHREWLDAHPRYRWPPDRDAVNVELA